MGLIFFIKTCENKNIKILSKKVLRSLYVKKLFDCFVFEKLSFKGDGWQLFQKLFHFDLKIPPAVDRLCADGSAMNKDYLEIKSFTEEILPELAKISLTHVSINGVVPKKLRLFTPDNTFSFFV